MKNANKLRLLIAFILLAVGRLSLNAQVAVSSGGSVPNASYSTLKGAFDQVNSGFHTGIINITITGNTSESASAILKASGTGSASYSSLSIQPSGGPWTISGAFNSTGLIVLDGANNVKIDGGLSRNLIFSNNGTVIPASIWLKSSGAAGLGCSNDTIINCQISSGLLNAESYGVILSGYNTSTPVPTYSLAAYNSNNVLIKNNKIFNCYYGISATGNNAALSDNFKIESNEIGNSDVATSIGKYGIYIDNMDSICILKNKIYNVVASGNAYGVYLNNTKSLKIQKNTITNINSTSAASSAPYGPFGIYLNTSFNIASIKGYIEGNTIMTVAYTGSSNINVDAYGIYANKSPYLEIRNNSISGILGSGYGSSILATAFASSTYGIFIDDASSQNINIYYNSINLSGKYPVATGASNYNTISAAIGLNNFVSPINIFNNVLADSIIKNSNSAGFTSCYAIYAASGLTFNGTTNKINYNDYYVNGSGANIAYYNSTNYPTLSSWQGVVATDANSKVLYPKFNAPTVLNPLPNSLLLGNGISISGISSDLNDKARSVTPTLGAFENALDAIPPTLTFAKLTNTASTINRTLNCEISDNYTGVDTSSANKPRLYYKKSTAPNDSANWKYVNPIWNSNRATFTIDYSKINGASIGDTIQYFIIAQDLESSQANIILSSGTLYQEQTNINLLSKAFPINGKIDSYIIYQDFSGVKTVGLNGNYPNLTGINGAFNAINNTRVTGDITLKIISDIVEPGTIGLQSYLTANNFEKIIIAPSIDTVRTISGAINNSGLIRFINTKNIIIDGSYNGSGRYLKFNNSVTASTSIRGATLQITNNNGATALGCRNITIKNSIIVGPDYTSGSTSTYRFAIYAGNNLLDTGSTVSMADHDSITIENNLVYHGYYLIYSSGGSFATTNDNWIIKSNLLAGAAVSTETNTPFAIYSSYSNKDSISWNTITLSPTDETYAIYQTYNNYSTILNNNILSCGSTSAKTYGVFSNFNTNCSINNNVLNSLSSIVNAYAIYCNNGVNDTIANNTIYALTEKTTNASYSIYGIYNSNSNRNSICGNQLIDCIGGSGTIYGIYNEYSLYCSISSNTLKNFKITKLTSGTIYGIFNKSYANSVLSGNLIDNITCYGNPYGIYNYGYYSATYSGDTLILTNNALSRINSTAATTGATYPLYIYSGKGHKLINNSVHLSGNGSFTSSIVTCLFFSSSSTQTIVVDSMYNNTFSNCISNSKSGKSYAVYVIGNYLQFNNTLGGLGKASDYNNFFTSSGVAINNYVVRYNSTDYQTMLQWRTATSQDAHSISLDPLFVSSSLLEPFDWTSPLYGAGVSSSVIKDIIEEIRDIHSIGAYEHTNDLLNPLITYNPIANANASSVVTLNAQISDNSSVDTNTTKAPRLYYKKSSQSNDALSWKYVEGVGTGSLNLMDYLFTIDYSKIGNVNPGDLIQYFLVAQDTLSKANVGFSSGVFPASKQVSVDLKASAFPISGYSSYLILPEFSGVKTVGALGDYPNLTGNGGLFFNLNNGVLIGDLTVKIVSDINEPGTYELNNITRVGGDYKINIVPNGAIPRNITGTGGVSSNGGLIRFTSVRNITIDGSINNSGKYLTFVNTSSDWLNYFNAIIQIAGPDSVTGCRNIIFKNCNIIGTNNTASNNKSVGIYVGNSNYFTITSSNDVSNNDSISIVNNKIIRANYGIIVAEGKPTSNNDNLLIENNIIGSNNSTEYVTLNGMYLNGCAFGTIRGNEVFNVMNDNSNSYLNPIGILINNLDSFAVIEKNIIHGIYYKGTSTGGLGEGLVVGDNSTCKGLKIINNAIYDINSFGYNSYPKGISINGSHDSICVYHNSINLFGSYFPSANSTNINSASLFIGGEPTNLDIKNNIFTNTLNSVSALSGGSYAIFIEETTFDFTLNKFDFNDYYSNPSNPNLIGVGFANNSKVQSIVDWKSISAGLSDLNSFSEDPKFNSNSILNLCYASHFIISNFGTNLGVDQDILNNTRLKPTIGAYELPVDVVPPVISYNKLLDTVQVAQISLSSTINDINTGLDLNFPFGGPKLYFKKTSQANDSSNWKVADISVSSPVCNFILDSQMIGGFNVGDTIQYFIIARDLNGNPNYTFTSGSTSGVLTSTQLLASNFPIIGSIESFTILDQLSGVKTVGVGGEFKSITGDDNGVFKKINGSIIIGNVTFKIKSDLIESGAVALNSFKFRNNLSYKINIIPDTNIVRTISGAYNGALLRFQSVNGLSVDGSFNGNGRYLKFINTPISATSSASTISLYSSGIGCKNISIQNSIIVGPANTIPSVNTSTYAIFAGSSSFGSSYGNNDSINIINNVIFRGYNLIYGSGTGSQNNKYWTIKDNYLGASSVVSDNESFNGIYINNYSNSNLLYNTINGIKLQSILSSSPSAKMITCANSSNISISYNNIYNVSTNYGIYGISLESTSSTLVNKNIISDFASSNPSGSQNYQYGICVSSSSSSNDTISDNIIKNFSSNTASSISGIYLNNSQFTNVEKNKISSLNNNSGIGYSTYGIYNTFVKGVKMLDNLIKDISLGANVYGISCNNNIGIYEIGRNVISNLTSTFTSSGIYGIYSNSATDGAMIDNNSISGIYGLSNINGIYCTSSKKTSILYNSVELAGNRSSTGNTNGIFVQSSIVDTICNNTITNNTNNSGTGKNYCININTNTPGMLEHNNYYTELINSPNNFIGAWKGVNSITLSDWQVNSLMDLLSISADPVFISGSNLMPSTNSPLLGAGISTSVSYDIVNNFRARNSIGCYDDKTDINGPVISFQKFNRSKLESSKTIAVKIYDEMNSVDTLNNKPILYYKKSNDGNDSFSWIHAVGISSGKNDSTFYFTFDYSKLSNMKIGDEVQYFIIAQDNCNSPKPNVGINNGTSNFDFSNVNLTADMFPISGYNSYAIVETLSGIKTVGVNGNYPNLTGVNGAFNSINNLVLVGDLALKVNSDISEPSVISLNNIIRDGGDWKINIIPDTNMLRTLSGPSKNLISAAGVFILDGVRNVNIDGCFKGTGRYLKFTDSLLSGSLNVKTPIMQISGSDIGNGCANITIQNCFIQGQYSINGSAFNSYGLYIGSSSIDGNHISDNDSILIKNNVITRTQYGIYVDGKFGGNNDNLNIINNTIGSDISTDYVSVGGIFTSYSTKANIIGNEILNITNNVNLSGNFGINIGASCHNSIIERNIIKNVSYTGNDIGSGYGINISGNSSYLSIINNSISGINGTGSTNMPIGIALSSESNHHKLYYNSVNLYGEYTNSTFTTTSSAALFIKNSTTDSLDIRNNVFSNVLTSSSAIDGGSYSVYIAPASYSFVNSIFDFNDYYSNPSNLMISKFGFVGSDLYTYSEWQMLTMQDMYSKNSEPNFYSAELLMPNSTSGLLYSADTTVPIILDIVGNSRSKINPTIGAYEIPFSSTLPNVITNPIVNNILQTSAQSSGILISQGGSPIQFKGMIIDIAHYPTLTNNLAKIENGSGMGDIIANWTGLQALRTYYVRAYAVNLSGVSYGADVSFITLPNFYAPSVKTIDYTNLTKYSVKLLGEVQNDNNSPITERGFIWGNNSNISLKLNNILGKIPVGKTNNTYINSYEATINSLNALTDYYFKAYAINAVDTSHGAYISFTTLSDGYQVSGTITYAQYTASTTSKNMYLNGSKKMPFVPWVKLMQNGAKVDSVMADSLTGAFTFTSVANGEYTLAFDDTHAWSTTPSTKAYQLNIQDVALIRQCAAQVRNFDSLQIKAVNVNLDYKNSKPYFNVQDVSFIRMKNGGVNPLPTQWMMPNWVYGIETSPSNATTDTPAVLKTDMTVSVNGANQSFIIRCISAADVNGQ